MQKKRNIIVLLLDTVRAGDAAAGMPMLSRLAAHATEYTNAVSPATWTVPAHAAIFTNQRASSIKMTARDFLATGSIDPWFTQTKFLPKNARTLAGEMAQHGYTTSLFSNNPFLTSFTNLGTGFSRIYDLWMQSNGKYDTKLTKRVSGILKGGKKTRAKMIAASVAVSRLIPKPWVDDVYLSLRKRLDRSVARADGTYKLDRGISDTIRSISDYADNEYDFAPQFMFINCIEAHENYPVSDSSIVQDKWLYLSGINELDERTARLFHNGYMKRLGYLDRKVSDMLGTLKSKGLLDNATVVVTSDHGQFFGEHGLLYHSLFPYDEVSKVPLIAANYENGRLASEAESVSSNVSTSSLYESLLDIASGKEDHLNGNLRASKYAVSEHLGISEGWDGQLLNMLKGRSSVAMRIYETKQKYNMRAVAVYSGSMKLIHFFGRRQDELYNTAKDPTENANIIKNNRDVAHRLLNAYRLSRPLAAV